MIKNNSTPLSTESPIRIDAINTIKYTLLLDYHPPMYDENVESFFSSLFKHCQECCYRVFMDIKERHKSNEQENAFFGRSITWYDDVLNVSPQSPSVIKTLNSHGNKHHGSHSDLLFIPIQTKALDNPAVRHSDPLQASAVLSKDTRDNQTHSDH